MIADFRFKNVGHCVHRTLVGGVSQELVEDLLPLLQEIYVKMRSFPYHDVLP